MALTGTRADWPRAQIAFIDCVTFYFLTRKDWHAKRRLMGQSRQRELSAGHIRPVKNHDMIALMRGSCSFESYTEAHFPFYYQAHIFPKYTFLSHNILIHHWNKFCFSNTYEHCFAQQIMSHRIILKEEFIGSQFQRWERVINPLLNSNCPSYIISYIRRVVYGLHSSNQLWMEQRGNPVRPLSRRKVGSHSQALDQSGYRIRHVQLRKCRCCI